VHRAHQRGELVDIGTLANMLANCTEALCAELLLAGIARGFGRRPTRTAAA
jgi:hypothetical protein